MWTFLLSDVSKGRSCIMWRRHGERPGSSSLQFGGLTLKEPVYRSFLAGDSSQWLVRQFEPVLKQAEGIKRLWESESLIARSEKNIWPGQWNQWEKDPVQECDKEFKWHVRRAGFEYRRRCQEAWGAFHTIASSVSCSSFDQGNETSDWNDLRNLII